MFLGALGVSAVKSYSAFLSNLQYDHAQATAIKMAVDQTGHQPAHALRRL